MIPSLILVMSIIRRKMLAPFHYGFVQRGVLEVLLLSVGAGLLGTWIVMRGLAFYSHAVATAAFPGLVLADGLGFSAPLGAFAAAALFALGVERLAATRRSSYDSLTALALVGALALGVILASDVFHSGANVGTLLFGSLLLIDRSDVFFAAASSAAVLAGSLLLGRRWLATGFDPETAPALGLRSPLPDAVLLSLTALSIVSALAAIGALLATALFVVPAATVRLLTRRLPVWQAGSMLLAAGEGVAGLWLSVETNAPPGAAIAVLGGGVFTLVAGAHAVAPRIRRRALLAAGAAVTLLLVTGCASNNGGAGPSAVATTTQIGDWLHVLAGPDTTVHQILQPNTDPHEYEPRPKDVLATAGAKLVFENGDRLDAWITMVVSEAGGSADEVVLGKRVPLRLPGERSGSDASRYDPHWWHDPRNAEAAARAIGAALAHADRSHRREYERRTTAYLAKLLALDRGIAACFAAVPPRERKLVTDHDAFGYFAHRYGIQVVGAVIPSQTTQAQPSAGEIAHLIALIRREHVRAVFPESSLSPRLAETIARETGADSSYTLYGDTLGPRGSRGATYLGMEQANADAMVRGFTGGARGCAIRGIP
jgi:ABC-type Zn uptake system ZnuABC Zn-binding protein ZnuA/ABC-type Mn2+/Zn2+ transport system permease subunit